MCKIKDLKKGDIINFKSNNADDKDVITADIFGRLNYFSKMGGVGVEILCGTKEGWFYPYKENRVPIFFIQPRHIKYISICDKNTTKIINTLYGDV